MRRRFLAGLLGGLLLFVVLNILAAHWMSDCGLAAVLHLDACSDDIVRAGWPFKFFEEGGFEYHSLFSIPYLVRDIVAGVLAALLISVAGLRFPHRT